MTTNRVSSFPRFAIPAAVAGLLIGWTIWPSAAPAKGQTPASRQGQTPGQTRVSEKDGIAAFETVKAVLQHPRCQNCHIPGDAPLQFDEGLPHAQNILRGPDGKGSPGLPCVACHGDANPPASWGTHMPPGAPNWHLPPPQMKMVFVGLSSGELCGVLKNPKTNGGKNFDALIHHVTDDKLVGWGWSPGMGRAPVPIPRDEFVAKFKEWIAAGAPCAAP